MQEVWSTIPGVGKIACKKENGSPLPVEKFHRQRPECGLQSTGGQRVRHDWATWYTHTLPNMRRCRYTPVKIAKNRF